MPAAAVIPAPIAYIKVVAVKKLVVGSWAVGERDSPRGGLACTGPISPVARVVFTDRPIVAGDVYFEEIRVFKAGTPPEYLCME